MRTLLRHLPDLAGLAGVAALTAATLEVALPYVLTGILTPGGLL